MQSIRYRFARPSDVSGIIELMRPYNMHHIPSPEMPQIDDKYFFIAEYNGEMVGAAGFTFLSSIVGKTTLMAVRPDFSQQGIGKRLQRKRMELLRGFGCEKIITNADRPATISWYKRHFGYQEVGRLTKLHSFGLEDVAEWTTLEASLIGYEAKRINPDKVVINAALTGMVPRKKDNPYLPVTPAEIVKDAIRAADLGASIIHLHARDSFEEPTPDTDIYRRIISGIREKRPDVIICVTTSGRNYPDLEKRSMVLTLTGELKPDMASLSLGSMNFANQASINQPQVIQGLAKAMLERDIKPELEVFEAGMIDYAKYLFRKGFLRLPLYNNFLFGSLGTMAASSRNLRFLVENLPYESIWAATGIGSSQFLMYKEAIDMGGGVRVGLEDNLFLNNELKIPARNEELISRVLEIIDQSGRQVATPKELRGWLDM